MTPCRLPPFLNTINSDRVSETDDNLLQVPGFGRIANAPNSTPLHGSRRHSRAIKITSVLHNSTSPPDFLALEGIALDCYNPGLLAIYLGCWNS
jgi:hypothetical protein